MAKSKDKKLKTDLPEVSDIDFDFDDDFGVEFDQAAAKKEAKGRKPIGNMVRGVKSGISDTAKSPQFLKETLRKSLPSSYGTIAEATDDIATGATQLYDETVRELKPKINRIMTRVDSMVPENSGFLRKISDKLMKATGSQREEAASNQASQTEAAVQSTIAAVFQQQQARSDALMKAKDVIDDRIEQKRSDRSFKVSSSMAMDISALRQYTTGVTQAYQKKHLEIALRGYLSQEDFFRKSVSYMEGFRLQLEGLIKNTSLPEYAKITDFERVKEAGKNRMVQSLYGLANPIKQGVKNLMETGREYLQGVSMSLDNIENLINSAADAREQVDTMNEMLISMGEPPLTAAQMAGAQLGEAAIKKVRDEVAKRLKKKLDANPALVSTLARVASYATNPGGAISDLRGSEKWQAGMSDIDGLRGKLYRGADFILEHFTDQRNKLSKDGPETLDGITGPSKGFSKKAEISLTDIIPGHLAAIRREVTMLRTGSDDVPLYRYDYEKGEFATTKDLTSRVMDKLAREAIKGGAGWHARSLSEDFGGRDVDAKVQQELEKFFLKTSQIGNMSHTSENLRNTDYYDELSPDARRLIDKKLDEMDNLEKGKKETSFLDMSKKLRDTRGGISEGSTKVWAVIEKYIDAGYGDILEKEGLITRKSDGGFESTEKGLQYFMSDSVTKGLDSIRSDVNVKEQVKQASPDSLLSKVLQRLRDTGGKIKNMSPKDMLSGIKKTKLYNWKYKQGVGDGQPHSGPMAQDLRSNLGNDVAPDGKKIDLQSMNGAVLAGMQQLAEDVEGLQAGGPKKRGPSGKGVKDPVWLIQRDVQAIRKMAESGTGGGGMMGPGGIPQDGSYKSMFLGLINGISTLGTKAGEDAIDAAGNALTFTKDKVVNPALEFVKDKYEKYKDPAKDRIRELIDKGLALGGKALDMGNEFITNTLPDNFKKLKAYAKDAKDRLSAWFNEARDLYLPGGTEPVIRALKLKVGFYIDEETGEPITTIDQLSRVKGNIVDKAGNIILTLEERANGLKDRYGEEIKTTASKLFYTAVGALGALKDKVQSSFRENWPKLASRGKEAWAMLTGKLKKGLDGFSGMGGGLDREARDAIVDIRDILIGKSDEVRKRLSLPNKLRTIGDLLEAVAGPEDTAQGGGGGSDGDGPDAGASVDMSRRYGSRGAGGPAGPGLAARIQQGKAWLESKGGVKGVAGGLQERGRGYMDQFKGTRAGGAISDRLGRAKGWFSNSKAGSLATRFGNSRAGGMLASGAGKLKSIGGSLFKGAMGIGSSLLGSGMLGGPGSGEGGNTPDAHDDANIGKELGEGKEQGMASSTGSIPQNQRAQGDENGDGVRDGSVEDRRKRLEALKESRKKKAAEADLTRRYGGVAGGAGLAGMLGGVFDFLTSNFGTIMSYGKKMITSIFTKGKALKSAYSAAKAAKAASAGADLVKGAAIASDAAKAGSVAKGVGAAGKISGALSKLPGAAALAGAAGSLTKIPGLGAMLKKAPALGAILDVGLGTMELLDDPDQKKGTFKSAWDFLSPFKYGAWGGKQVNKGINGALSAVTGSETTLGSSIYDAVEGVGKMFDKGKEVIESKNIIDRALRAAPGLNIVYGAIQAITDPYVKKYGKNTMNKFEEIRLRQYGFAFNDKVRDYSRYVFILEGYLQDGRISWSRDEVASVNDKRVKAEEIMEFFKIEKSDKEQARRFVRWYEKRFIPIFTKHLTVLSSIDEDLDLDEVHTLKPDQQIVYLTDTLFKDGPYKILTSPLKYVELLSSEFLPIENLTNALIAELRGKTSGKDSKAPAAVASAARSAPAEAPSDLQSDIDKADKDKQLLERGNQPKATTPDQQGQKTIAEALKGGQSEDGPDSKKADSASSSSGASSGSKRPDLPQMPANIPKALPVAPGPLADGSGADKFIKLKGSNVTLSGVHPRMLKYFKAMVQEYGEKTGRSVQVNDGFRSYAMQQALYEKSLKDGKPGSASKPGGGVHEVGFAIDINSVDADALDNLGLMKKYGFTRPVGKETWHIEPAGIGLKLNEAKANPAVADAQIAASLGRGGGGYGTDKSVQKYGRNPALALKLWEAGGQAVDPKAAEASGAPMLAKADTPEAKSATNKLPPVPEGQGGSSGTTVASAGSTEKPRPATEAKPVQSGSMTTVAKNQAPVPSKSAPVEQGGDPTETPMGHRALVSAQLARERFEKARANDGLSLPGVEKAISISNSHLERISATLENILTNVQIDKVASVLAAAVKSGGAVTEAADRKTEDNRRMGRTDKVRPSSLDLSRRA